MLKFTYRAEFFQFPNVFIDKVTPYLTDAELRVMLYAMRHVLGWQDTLAHRQKHISMTNFADGYTTTNGTVYEGTGLTETTIRKALAELVKYGLLERIGEPGKKGQFWYLPEECDLEGLIQRSDAKFEANRLRTTAGRAKPRKNSKKQGDMPQPQGYATSPQGDMRHPSEGDVPQPQINTPKTKERHESVSDDTRTQGVSQTEATPSLKPTASAVKSTTPSLPGAAEPLSPKKARSAKQQANDAANAALVKALGEAYGVPATQPDEKNYLTVARDLIRGTVPVTEFKWYFQFQNRVAQKGNYTIQTLRGYLANERISQYVKARTAYRADQAAGKVNGAWTGGETQPVKRGYDKRTDPAYAYLYAGKGEK